MRFYSFSLLIEKDAEDGGYLAWSPDLPGCVSAGGTTEEEGGACVKLRPSMSPYC